MRIGVADKFKPLVIGVGGGPSRGGVLLLSLLVSPIFWVAAADAAVNIIESIVGDDVDPAVIALLLHSVPAIGNSTVASEADDEEDFGNTVVNILLLLFSLIPLVVNVVVVVLLLLLLTIPSVCFISDVDVVAAIIPLAADGDVAAATVFVVLSII